jgi:hypothetical protein
MTQVSRLECSNMFLELRRTFFDLHIISTSQILECSRKFRGIFIKKNFFSLIKVIFTISDLHIKLFTNINECSANIRRTSANIH